MIHAVKNMLTAYHMVSEGDHVICALSGGRDSVALLHCMAALAPVLHITVTAAHFNHCLRGEESDRDEAFVQSLCEGLGIPLECGRADVRGYASVHQLGTEEAARTLRYQFLFSLDPEAKVATAHNADDNLETLLLHLVRGCGLHGLGGIPPVRARIIRPLLTCDRDTITAWLTAQQLTWVEDSTNSEDAYLRNRLRHHVVPLLRAENPAIAASVSQLELKLRQEDAFLDTCAENAFQALTAQSGKLEIPGLLSQPEALRYRILLKFMKDIPELSSTQITAAMALCVSACPSGSLSLTGGKILRRNYDLLQLTTETETAQLTGQLLTCSEPVYWGSWKIEMKQAAYTCNPGKASLAIAFRPEGHYTVRPRQAGDRLKLPGGTKKISRYMIDRKIPLEERDRYPVLCIDGSPAALLPLVSSVAYRPQQGTPCLIITANKMEDIK